MRPGRGLIKRDTDERNKGIEVEGLKNRFSVRGGKKKTNNKNCS